MEGASYPFEAGLSYVRNAWYVAGWSHELDGTLQALRFLDEPVVLFRASNGSPTALADRCAHRAFPLSAGCVDGDVIRCGYHGWAYDSTGKCVSIAAPDRVPIAYRVRRYPTHESAGVVWIWMGDPDQADPSLLPDLAELGFTDPRYHSVIGGLKIVKCRYQLINENLLDLSHITFLHPGTIGTPQVTAFPVTTTVADGAVTATRTIYNDEATPFHTRSVGIAGRMDRTTRSVFLPPAAHATHVTMVEAGSGARYGEPGYFGEFKIVHLLAPAGLGETRYYWAINRTARTDDETTAYMRPAFDAVFDQDVTALELQERGLRDAPDFSEVSCKADEAAIKTRRLLSKMMRQELAARPARPAAQL